TFQEMFVLDTDVNRSLIGKPIDHPDVTDFIKSDFYAHLDLANQWLARRRSIVVKYEELHQNPISAVKRVTDQIRSVSDDTIERALAASSADAMRQRDEWMEKHIRSARVGDWANHLTREHIEAFRRHALMILRLGYPVL